jgi:hypothetical protein
VLLFQTATSLSFRFLVVMPFAGFSGIIFGGSPAALNLDFFQENVNYYNPQRNELMSQRVVALRSENFCTRNSITPEPTD